MSGFRPARGFVKRAHQRAAIATAYALAWREADRAELPRFVEMVGEFIARWDDDSFQPPWEVHFKQRRREIMLCVPGRDYRAVLVRGVEPWTKGAPALKLADVERFERRQAR